jgi:aromatic-L-amino-acid decarboxylase
VKNYPTAFLHIDAAWAGVAYALPNKREQLRLVEVNQYADSFGTNMHKWGLVGFDCCKFRAAFVKFHDLDASPALFYIKDRELLTKAMDVTPVSRIFAPQFATLIILGIFAF